MKIFFIGTFLSISLCSIFGYFSYLTINQISELNTNAYNQWLKQSSLTLFYIFIFLLFLYNFINNVLMCNFIHKNKTNFTLNKLIKDIFIILFSAITPLLIFYLLSYIFIKQISELNFEIYNEWLQNMSEVMLLLFLYAIVFNFIHSSIQICYLIDKNKKVK